MGANDAIHNQWRESLINCATGDNFLRCQEWHDLADELDRLYAAESQAAELRARCEALARLWRGIPQNQDIERRDRIYIAGYDKALSDCAAAIDALLAEPSAQGVGNG